MALYSAKLLTVLTNQHCGIYPNSTLVIAREDHYHSIIQKLYEESNSAARIDGDISMASCCFYYVLVSTFQYVFIVYCSFRFSFYGQT